MIETRHLLKVMVTWLVMEMNAATGEKTRECDCCGRE
jgi:hypothetical protein